MKNKGQFIKGTSPWNKGTIGIMKFNQTSFKKGFHNSPKTEFKKGEMSERQKGENNSNWKGGISLEVKRCIDCGKILTGYIHKRCRKCSEEFRVKENHPNWQGGKSFEIYGIDFNNQLKEKIRQRDKCRCQECFRHQNELYSKNGRKYKLIIHHIDFNKNNNKESNLISLCRNCHLQTNYNRKDWINYFEQKICLKK